MKATITLQMDYGAFHDSPAGEPARILRNLANRIEAGELPPIKLRDSNNNVVGAFTITEDAA